MAGLRGVIFDCDGVMIDSSDANISFYNRFLEYFGLAPLTEEQKKYVVMASVRESLAHILPPDCYERALKENAKIVNYTREILPLVKIFPGFLAFIDFLHQYKIKMAVLTNRTAPGMQAVLDFFSLPSYFSPVMTTSCGFIKPHPGGAFQILSQWAFSSEEVLYVGDSELDYRTALAANIPFVWISPSRILEVTGGFHVSSYQELEEILLPRIEQG